jgi:hypothetical protein
MYKPNKIHVVIDALSRPLDNIEPTCVLDQTTYASLFYTKHEQLKDVKDFLRTRPIEGTLSIQQK